MPDIKEVHALSTTLTLVAFAEDGGPAESARHAHSVFCHWTLTNLTDGDYKLTFELGALFEIQLLAPDDSVLWSSTPPAPGSDYTVVVPSGGGRFMLPPDPFPPGLPPQSAEIRLQKILEEAQIPDDADITVAYRPLAQELDQVVHLKLWR